MCKKTMDNDGIPECDFQIKLISWKNSQLTKASKVPCLILPKTVL